MGDEEVEHFRDGREVISGGGGGGGGGGEKLVMVA